MYEFLSIVLFFILSALAFIQVLIAFLNICKEKFTFFEIITGFAFLYAVIVTFAFASALLPLSDSLISFVVPLLLPLSLMAVIYKKTKNSFLSGFYGFFFNASLWGS
ncbi:MAG: hypothetical protein FWF79_02840 [Defluviitaleaceae bacterium]|nr:hypothetical protein [Defluviitaleaceae bacterium]